MSASEAEAYVPDLLIDVDNTLVCIGGVAAAISATVLQLLFPPTTERKAKSKYTNIIAASIILVTLAIVAFLIWESYSDIRLRKIAAPHSYPNYRHLIITLYSFALLTVSRVILVPLFQKLGNKLISKKQDHRERKVQRFAGQLWKVIFHGTVAILPLTFCNGQLWWPPDRIRDPSSLFENYPFTPQIKYIREYYMFQLGYYFHALLATLLQRGRPNYIEMTVHHMATLALVFVSYFVQNANRFGTVVLWLHDICDVPVSFTRLVIDLSFDIPTIISYIILLVLWAYYRLYVFPIKVLSISICYCFRDGYVKFKDAYGFVPLNLLMVLLVFMHVKWFVELAFMGYNFAKTGKKEDSTEAHVDEKAEKFTKETSPSRVN